MPPIMSAAIPKHMMATSRNPGLTAPLATSATAITTTVDAQARASDTRIEIVPPDGAPFAEEHRQHFHAASDVRAAVAGAGFTVTAVRDGYSTRAVDGSTLTATWIARRPDAHT